MTVLWPAGVFAPTLFSKAYGSLVCDACTISDGGNATSDGGNATFICRSCHYDLVGDATQPNFTYLNGLTLHNTFCHLNFQQTNYTLFHNHVQ